VRREVPSVGSASEGKAMNRNQFTNGQERIARPYTVRETAAVRGAAVCLRWNFFELFTRLNRSGGSSYKPCI
jgi:hypothetical protein